MQIMLYYNVLEHAVISIKNTHTQLRHTSVNPTALMLNITYLLNITHKREWLFNKHYSSN
jgi:hypothetical protein